MTPQKPFLLLLSLARCKHFTVLAVVKGGLLGRLFNACLLKPTWMFGFMTEHKRFVSFAIAFQIRCEFRQKSVKSPQN